MPGRGYGYGIRRGGEAVGDSDTRGKAGGRRGVLKDKSKFSRFIHLMGVHLISMHLMGVCLMSMHLIGVHLISLCLIPLGGKCDPPLNLWALTERHIFLMGCSR